MGKPLKIIACVTNDLTYDQRMERISGTLSDAGYSITLVGRIRSNSIPLKNISYEQVRLGCYFQKGKWFYIEYTIRLFFYLLLKKCDVILANDLDTLLPCTIVAKIKSRKLVFDAHEYFTEVPELIGRSSIKKVWQKVASWCIPHANVCYTVSDNLARIFEEKYKKHFYIIRNVPLMHELIDGHNTHHDKPIIIYQGDLNVGRGIEETMHAIVNKDVEYWIAGDGPIKEHLQKRIKELDINNKVKLLGYLTPDELRKCTSKADVGINLLQPQSLSYYYSLSNKFFNYMHAGVPQICAPFPEYEVINNHCRIAVFANCNATEISDAIDILLKDKNLYQQLKTNCFKASKMYHWEEEKNKLISIYQTLN